MSIERPCTGSVPAPATHRSPASRGPAAGRARATGTPPPLDEDARTLVGLAALDRALGGAAARRARPGGGVEAAPVIEILDVDTGPVSRDPVAVSPAAIAARSRATLFGVVASPRPAAPVPGEPAPIPIELEAIDPAVTIELTPAMIATLLAESPDLAGAPPAAHARAAPAAAVSPTAPRPAAARISLTAHTPAAARAAPASRTAPAPRRAVPASLTAPGPTAPAVGPDATWWIECPPFPPPRPRSRSAVSAGPEGHRRPPRIGLVLVLLLASLLGGLLAPVCWGVARAELGRIERGTVEDRHRGLLTAALLWGIFATGALAVVALGALAVATRAGVH